MEEMKNIRGTTRTSSTSIEHDLATSRRKKDLLDAIEMSSSLERSFSCMPLPPPSTITVPNNRSSGATLTTEHNEPTTILSTRSISTMTAPTSTSKNLEELPELVYAASFTDESSFSSSLEEEIVPISKSQSLRNDSKENDQISYELGFWTLQDPENTKVLMQSPMINNQASNHHRYLMGDSLMHDGTINIEVVEEASCTEVVFDEEEIVFEEEDDGDDGCFHHEVFDDKKDDDYFRNKVSRMPDDEDASGESDVRQLLINTFNARLQQKESMLEMERNQRRSREQSIAALAKILMQKDATISNQQAAIEKLRDQLVMERQDLEKEIVKTRNQYDTLCVDYEHRIDKINKSHSKQCDDMCREANRENIRLRQQLETLTRKKNASLSLQDLLTTIVVTGYALFRSATKCGGGTDGVGCCTCGMTLLEADNIAPIASDNKNFSSPRQIFWECGNEAEQDASVENISSTRDNFCDEEKEDGPGLLSTETSYEEGFESILLSQAQEVPDNKPVEDVKTNSRRRKRHVLPRIVRRISKLGSGIKRHVVRKKKKQQ